MQLIKNDYFFAEGFTGHTLFLVKEEDDGIIVLGEDGSVGNSLVIHERTIPALVKALLALLPEDSKAEVENKTNE